MSKPHECVKISAAADTKLRAFINRIEDPDNWLQEPGKKQECEFQHDLWRAHDGGSVWLHHCGLTSKFGSGESYIYDWAVIVLYDDAAIVMEKRLAEQIVQFGLTIA